MNFQNTQDGGRKQIPNLCFWLPQVFCTMNVLSSINIILKRKINKRWEILTKKLWFIPIILTLENKRKMIYCKKEVCATELDLLCKTKRRPCHVHREFYFFLLYIVDFHFFFLPTCSWYDVQMWIFWSSFRSYRKHNSLPSEMLLAIDVSYIFTIIFRTFLFLKKIIYFFILSTISLPSPFPSPCCFPSSHPPQIHSSCNSIRKRAGLHGYQ